jgi:uncharacterized membrane protein YeaQ/YmgE (transglycosylase-associated protein family)
MLMVGLITGGIVGWLSSWPVPDWFNKPTCAQGIRTWHRTNVLAGALGGMIGSTIILNLAVPAENADMLSAIVCAVAVGMIIVGVYQLVVSAYE